MTKTESRTSFILASLALVMLLALVPLCSASPSENAPRIHVKDGTSTNWAGYAALTSLTHPQSGAVTDVKGNWTVPAVNCANTPTAYSSTWIGIDGDFSKTVEQIGTDSDCSSGKAVYYTWYEMYPQFPANIPMTIKPGDKMSAEVKYQDKGNFVLTMTDMSTGNTFTKTLKSMNAKRVSAEWIEEAPSSASSVLALANFGTVSFTGASATLNGVPGAINNSHWTVDNITMVRSDGTTVKAQQSPLSSDGTSFSVTWKNS